jgi:hypothetical protein
MTQPSDSDSAREHGKRTERILARTPDEHLTRAASTMATAANTHELPGLHRLAIVDLLFALVKMAAQTREETNDGVAADQ